MGWDKGGIKGIGKGSVGKIGREFGEGDERGSRKELRGGAGEDLGGGGEKGLGGGRRE